MSSKKVNCTYCAKNNTTTSWCRPCNAERFREDFSKWTSGSKLVDKFIQKAQLNARSKEEVIEWIPYKNFQSVEHIAQGGFSKVYKARWPGGRIICSGTKNVKWWRQDKTIEVALKSLDNSEEISKEFLDELESHYLFIRRFTGDKTTKNKPPMLLIFGITRHPSTNNFMIVTKYVERGSLRTRLQNPNYEQYEWADVLKALRDLTITLASIHEAGLVHRDFHSGNILVEYVDIPFISDFGLSRNAKQNDEGKVFGVLPYVAPEVLIDRKPYTQAADIYSLGMILWEYIAGVPPFSDRAHDSQLALDIGRGLRPKILPGTPTIFANLMKQCWDGNPEKRPTSQQVKDIAYEWNHAYSLYRFEQPHTKEQEKIGKNFEAAEEYRLRIGHGGARKGKLLRGYATHPEAWTVSRLLDFPSLEKKLQESEPKTINEEEEMLDETGHLIVYGDTHKVEFSFSDDED